MKKSYFSNYIRTYLWQGIAIILNLVSMFIVIPMITDNKVIYGVYSICISAAMFLSYSDLGFVSAGIKYAGESFVRGEHTKEIKYYAFSGFIMVLFVSIISVIYLIFSFNPSLLIKDIDGSKYIKIASSLLLIQAIFSFNTVIQRFVTGVFQVRIEQYVYQQINIIGSLLKISSVFYFFSNGKYDIVGYFLFIKIVELITLLVGVTIIRNKYKISIAEYIKSFTFNREIYNKTKGLAFSSLFVTFMWILYYELDIIVIGKLIGASAVAIYALAFTFMKFLRSFSSIVFSPFQNRYNHFVGLKDYVGLKKLLHKVILFSMPLFVIPIFSIVILSDNIVVAWAGQEYIESGIILALLAINFMYSFIRTPGSGMLVTLVRIKEMYWITAVSTVVFWVGIFLTKNYFGVNSFAIFKLLSGTLVMIFYFNFLTKFLKIGYFSFFKETMFRMILPLITMLIFLLISQYYLPSIKGKLNLLIVISTGGLASIIGFVVLYFSSNYYKTEFNYYIKKIIPTK